MTCKAKQYSDQMICGKCGIQWDVNDPDPPVCAASRQADQQSECQSHQGNNQKSSGE